MGYTLDWAHALEKRVTNGTETTICQPTFERAFHEVENPPVVSTVGEVLKRHGMVKARRRRGGLFKVERGTLTAPERCNHVMGVDYKGWFLLGDGMRCDPLTMSDLHSRFVMKPEVMPDMTVKWS